MKTLKLKIMDIRLGNVTDGKLVILTQPVPEDIITRAGNNVFQFPTIPAPNTESTRTSAQRLWEDVGLQSVEELKLFGQGGHIEFDVVEHQFGVTPITNAQGEPVLDPATGKQRIAGDRIVPERVAQLKLKKGDTIHRLENVRVVLSSEMQEQVNTLRLNDIVEERKLRSQKRIETEFEHTNTLLARLASKLSIVRTPTQTTATQTKKQSVKEVVDGDE